MSAATLVEQVFHVFEELHMSPLIAGNGNPLGVFFNGGLHDLFHTSVMPEVNDLGPLLLQDPSHNINGRVMAVKQAGGGNDADGGGRRR